ncbi:MAG: MFS transporter [Chloroflexi bacterium]|nr:MFS transporter [Chloroflexota bacterium]
MNQARFLAVVAVSLFVTQSASLIVAPLLVDIATEFDSSVAVAGQLATATFAAWAVSVVISGPMSDSLGRRPVALAGLSLLSIGVMPSAFAPNLGILLVLMVVTRLGGGMIPPNSMAAVADVVSPARRAQALGGLLAFTTLSSVIGVPLVAVLADWGDWRSPFLVAGSLLAVCTFFTWLWFPKSGCGEIRPFSFFSRYKTLLANPVFRAAMAANLGQRIAFFALFSYSAAYLIDAYDINLGEVALPLAIIGIGPVVGSYIAGIVGNWNNRVLFICACSLAGGLAASMLFLIDVPIWVILALGTCATALLSVGWPVLITLTTEISGESQATGIGLLGSSNQLGGVEGAALGGVMLAAVGFPGVGYLCLGAVLFSAVVITLFMRQPHANAKLSSHEPM